MNGEQSELRVHQAEPRTLPELSLTLQRVLDEYVRIPLRAEFRFDPDAPMIISATFAHGRGSSVTWHINRELLRQGLYEECGDGDVQMWPTRFDEERTWLMLESRDASAVFELPVPTMAEWIESTYQAVPAEAESGLLDWDGFLEDLLGSGELPSG
ncbi:SsgA family sporulation/cell division regulator [Streptomyces sp. cg35]|uniref:SsgA family sporulation/cell division regulator n=1 Tax=Streptomyces sp. cg35 TaxID=3421650 RepID=UPI003D17FB2F